MDRTPVRHSEPDAPQSEPARGTTAPVVQVQEDSVVPCYANFCRVTGTPEEVVLDFGINTQPFGPTAQPVRVQQRVVMNFYTAKRMLRALELTIQRHEAAFGVLETDVQKRVLARQEQSEAA